MNHKRAPYGTWRCKICGKILESRRLLKKHLEELHPDRPTGKGWSKGLTKETSPAIAKMSISVREGIIRAYKEGKLTGRCKDPIKEQERRIKISNTCKKNKKSGGLRHNSGVGHKGWYNGYFCDSTWELAYVVYNIDHNILFERNKEGFDYIFESKTRKYFPDFILEDGTFVEIKGYVSDQWKAKLEQFPKDKKLIVIDKDSIKPYIDYVIKNYGKKLEDVY